MQQRQRNIISVSPSVSPVPEGSDDEALDEALDDISLDEKQDVGFSLAPRELSPELQQWRRNYFIKATQAVEANNLIMLKALLGPSIFGFEQKAEQEKLHQRHNEKKKLRLDYEIECIKAAIDKGQSTFNKMPEVKLQQNTIRPADSKQPPQTALDAGSVDIIIGDVRGAIEAKLIEIKEALKKDINIQAHKLADQRNMKKDHAESRFTEAMLQIYEKELLSIKDPLLNTVNNYLVAFKNTKDFNRLMHSLKALLSNKKRNATAMPVSPSARLTPKEQAISDYTKWLRKNINHPDLLIHYEKSLLSTFIQTIIGSQIGEVPLASMVADTDQLAQEEKNIEKGDTLLHIALRIFAARPLQQQHLMLPMIKFLMKRCSPYVKNDAGKTAFDVANDVINRQLPPNEEKREIYPTWPLVRLAIQYTPVFSDYGNKSKKVLLSYCKKNENILRRIDANIFWHLIYSVIYNMQIKIVDRLEVIKILAKLLYEDHCQKLTDVSFLIMVRALNTVCQRGARGTSGLFDDLLKITPREMSFLSTKIQSAHAEDLAWVKEQAEKLKGPDGNAYLQTMLDNERRSRKEKEISHIQEVQELRTTLAEQDAKHSQEIGGLNAKLAKQEADLANLSQKYENKMEEIDKRMRGMVNNRTSRGRIEHSQPPDQVMPIVPTPGASVPAGAGSRMFVSPRTKQMQPMQVTTQQTQSSSCAIS